MPDTPNPWVGLAALVAIFLLPFVSGHVKLLVGGQLSLDPPIREWGGWFPDAAHGAACGARAE